MKLPRWSWKQIGLPGPTEVRVNGKRVQPHRIYRIWHNIMIRGGVIGRKGFARDRHAKYYVHVTVCDLWRSFPEFYKWAMAHGYREDLTIDRIDWRRGYCPENCRWAAYTEQNRNRHFRKRGENSGKERPA